MGWGVEANEHPAELQTHDRFGSRRDEVEFHPEWHGLMRAGVGRSSTRCRGDRRRGAHVARARSYVCSGQAEAGFGCPITMTFAAVPALRTQPDVAAEWVPRLTATSYDPELRAEKPSALCGMAMTEKQGGSDVRANTTGALAGDDGWWEITGHKWFCSAPMCDLFLVLAQTDEGVTCFALPRVLPDGARNEGFQLQRLKDKLGNRSNASSEVEFRGALAQIVGEPGRGVPTIIEMVKHTRLDCVVGTGGRMRAAVAQRHPPRRPSPAFGKRLAEQPLMDHVLADLADRVRGGDAFATMRLARAYDEGATPRSVRLGTAVLKYWICKRGAGAHRRGARGAGRQRVRRGVGNAPPLPRGAAELGVGGVGQRDVPRRPARALARPGDARGLPRRGRRGARGRRPARRVRGFAPGRVHRPRGARAARAADRRAHGARGSRGRSWSASGLPASADAFSAARLAGDAGLAFGTVPASIDARCHRRAAHAAGVIGPHEIVRPPAGGPASAPEPGADGAVRDGRLRYPGVPRQSVKRPTSSSSSRAVRDSSWAEAAICWVEALVSCAEAETCWTVAEDCSATLATSTMSLVTWAAPVGDLLDGGRDLADALGDDLDARGDARRTRRAPGRRGGSACSPRAAPGSTTARSARSPADLDDEARRSASPRPALLGQLADLVGDDGEAAALLAGARGLDGRVEGEQVGLLGDCRDGVDDAADALALGTQIADGLARFG